MPTRVPFRVFVGMTDSRDARYERIFTMAKKIPSAPSKLTSTISNLQSLRVLIVEDSESDALLEIHELKKGGYDPVYERVETAAAMKKALSQKQWDIILCDYKMPEFNAPSAIAVLKETNIDIPLIIVSGAIGEQTAVECMRSGAHDYMMKGNLSRLVPAIQRELKDAESRREHKQAEDALRESENKYRLLADNVNDVIFLLDMNLNYTYVSPSIKILRGYEPEELLNKPPTGTLTPASMDLAMKTLSEFMELEKSEHREINKPPTLQLEMVRKDGSTVWTEVKFSFIRDENQRPLGIMGVTRDITERRQTEEALRESEEKFRVLVDSTPTAVMLYQDDRWIYANRAAETLCGYSEKELLAMNFWDIVHPDFKPLIKERGGMRQQGKETKIRYEFKIIAKDGTEKWADLSGASTMIQGRTAGIISVLDITESKQAEEALRTSEELFRNYLEYAPDGVYMSDVKGTFLYGNRKCEEIIGYKREEMIGKNFLELNILSEKSLNKAVELLQANMESKPTGPDEIELISKEGRLIPVEINTNVVQRSGEGIVLAFVRDITERKQAEYTIRESEEKYRTILEDMDDVYFEVDIKGNITFVNPSSCKMSGYSEEELIGMPFKKISALGDIEKVMQYFGEIFLTGKTGKPFLWNLVKKNGEQGFFEIVVFLIRDKQGKPIGFRGIGRDVTERRKAEAVLQQTLERLRKAFGTTVQVMVSAVEARDPYTAGHQLRTANLARAIATEMGLPQEKIEGIRMAGFIHDIGKLSVPAEILTKPTKLTELEFSMIKEHAQKGYEMLKDVESPWPLAQIVYQHHERMDGSGYPRKLQGDDIIIEARIMAVADVVEAMASYRPYRPALGIETALEEIEKNRGMFYDADAVDACLRLFREKGFQLERI